MKRIPITIFFVIINLFTWASVQPIIPQPAEFSAGEGFFKVPSIWMVNSCLPKEESHKILEVLKQPVRLLESKKSSEADLILKEDKTIGEEGYNLTVSPENVIIKASTEKGFYYALQSLYQLSKLGQGGLNGTIACCTINDYPRFQHRGLMLDVTRYFIPKEEVLKIIDAASALKLNTLHMHLSDDNGWRMEIKKYPKLTEVGAWRVDRDEIFPGRKNPVSADEPTPIGGFYTQDDLKDIVAYASERHIDVIPEIEMPAHAAAAIASYPELACPVVDKFVGVFPGIGGKDASIIMCGGNENVYNFYKDVIDEVVEIFPSQYIHLGGDEADKSIWKECELCNQKIKDLNLKDYEELQAYFMDQINSYVRSKGRTAMGWDEVTYGDPKEDMVILGWQGDGNVAVNDARKSGRKFIMTPAKTLYLIRYQGPQWFEPFTYFGNNTLSDVYNYEPVKSDWTPEMKDQLLGIQGSLWTEFCQNNDDVEYLLFPRLLAVADGAWRQENSSDWESFLIALDNYLPELDSRDINFAKSMYNIQHKVMPSKDGVVVDLQSERPDLQIKYNNLNDGLLSFNYDNPISLDSNTILSAVTYKGGEPMGQPLTLNIDFNKATGAEVLSENCSNGLKEVLTNGLRGSNKSSDFEWAGWHNRDAEFIIDLGEVSSFNQAKLGTIGFSHICVVMPEWVEVYGSEDGEKYSLISRVEIPEELIYAKDSTKHDIDFGNLDAQARYLKFKAKNPGRIPAGFAREGAPSWLYFDEVIIN